MRHAHREMHSVAPRREKQIFSWPENTEKHSVIWCRSFKGKEKCIAVWCPCDDADDGWRMKWTLIKCRGALEQLFLALWVSWHRPYEAFFDVPSQQSNNSASVNTTKSLICLFVWAMCIEGNNLFMFTLRSRHLTDRFRMIHKEAANGLESQTPWWSENHEGNASLVDKFTFNHLIHQWYKVKEVSWIHWDFTAALHRFLASLSSLFWFYSTVVILPLKWK